MPHVADGLFHFDSRYAPAIRELFASVILDNEEHAQGVLSTLAADKRTDGVLALTVRKVCLVIGTTADRKPPPPPRIAQANLPLPPAPLQTLPQPNPAWPDADNDNALATDAAVNAWNQQGMQFHQFHLLQQLHNIHNLGVILHPPPIPNHQQLTQLVPNATPNAPADDWTLEVPVVLVHEGEMLYNTSYSGPSSLTEVIRQPGTRPLLLNSALNILSQTKGIQTLTIRLQTKTFLDDQTMTTLCNLKSLKKLDIAGKLSFTQLWQLLRSLPGLETLAVSGLSSGTEEEVITFTEDVFNSVSLSLRSISFYRSELNTDLLYGLLETCGNNIGSLKLSRFVTSSRPTFRSILRLIGSSLRQLALQRVVFTSPAPPAMQPQLLQLLDELPTHCPMLEELQVAAERITSPQHFLDTTLPSLFLTQLELDFYYPLVTEEQILSLIASLPAGRMETMSFGPKMAHLGTSKVQRACQEIGIVLLSADCT